MYSGRLRFVSGCLGGKSCGIQVPRMLIVMTVNAQQLPVAPVGRVIVMVVVLVMDRQLAQLLALKFAPAAGTDAGKNLERLLAIALKALLLADAGLSHNPVHPLTIQSFFL